MEEKVTLVEELELPIIEEQVIEAEPPSENIPQEVPTSPQPASVPQSPILS